MQPSPLLGRREFLKSVGSAAAGAALAGQMAPAGMAIAAPAAQNGEKRIRKAVKFDMFTENGTLLEKFKALKEIGFDGTELLAPNKLDPAEVLAARDGSGLPIHGVICSTQWAIPLSDNDPNVRKQALENLLQAIRDAKTYGASTVLLVPGVVKKDVPYDVVYKRSQEGVRQAIPLAKELGIVIAIENVWNNFLLSPLEQARYLDEFDSPWVRAYFDVGNILRHGWPEHWIHVLGKRIIKLDIKEYSIKKRDQEGLWKGFNVELMEGDCDWPTVMKALKEVGYTDGWGTAEVPGGGRDRMKFLAERMDKIFALQNASA